MGVCVGEHLPVEPGQTGGRDIVCPVLDVGITRARREDTPRGAVVVGSVIVACAPVV